MRSSNPQPIVQELARTTPELQAYVESLQADSDQLSNLTYYHDPGEGARIVALLAAFALRGAAHDQSYENTQDAANNFSYLADHILNFGEAIAHRQRTIAAQKQVA